MKVEALQGVERAVRRWRDDWIVRPLARSRLIEKATFLDLDIGIKNAGDHLIAFYPNDLGIGREIRRVGTWGRSSFDHAIKAARARRPDMAGKVFIDVGANIGTQTVYALLAGFGRAVSIEPVPENVRCLNLNAYINGYMDRITIVQKGAGAQQSRLQLSLDETNIGGHSIVLPKKAGWQKLEIEVTPVDDMLAELAIPPEQVGLLWIDVEGYEPQVIEGARRLISAAVPLVLEFNAKVYGVQESEKLLRSLADRYSFAGVMDENGVELKSTAKLSLQMLPSKQVDLLFL